MSEAAEVLNPEYVIIGHLTEDLHGDEITPGGTALYSGLTAHRLGLRVGIVTSTKSGSSFPIPHEVKIAAKESQINTQFRNIQYEGKRQQYMYQRAGVLEPDDIPAPWKSAKIAHLGPVADEVNPEIIHQFPEAMICLTPQGWMRTWDTEGLVHHKSWADYDKILPLAQVACISLEDVQSDETMIEQMASCIPVLAVTEAHKGASVFWHGDVRHFKAQKVREVDVTGAGDIFAAAFFYRFYTTRDPWEAARFANLIASTSVQRNGIDSIPTPAEIVKYKQEIIQRV